MAERMFSSPTGYLDRVGYVRYLRECANRWRYQPAHTEGDRLRNEEQARRVEAKADLIEKGEDE